MKFLAWPRYKRYNIILLRYDDRFKLTFVLSTLDWWASYYLVILAQQFYTVYSFRSRLVVSQESDLLFGKTKSSRTSNSHGFLYFFEILHTCPPYQCLQIFSLVCFVPLNEQSSFWDHVDLKLFLKCLYTSTDSVKKAISTDSFESTDKEKMQNFRED